MTSSLVPDGGYLRMPTAWLKLPVSPQAKTLLAAFCNSADDHGASWYSYEQLGEILQRSKASIANYVKELRDVGIIECIHQTYGNGYNYRLLVRLKGWVEILAAWAVMAEERRDQVAKTTRRGSVRTSSRSAQPIVGRVRPHSMRATETSKVCSDQRTECSVQPDECKDPSGPKTQPPQIQTPAAKAPLEWSAGEEEEWRKFRPNDRDPLFQWQKDPSLAVLLRVIDHFETLKAASDMLDQNEAERRAVAGLRAFVERFQIVATEEEMAQAGHAIAKQAQTTKAVSAALEALESTWKPHWRRLSSPQQITEAIRPAVEAAMPGLDERRQMCRFQTRAFIAAKWIEKHRPDLCSASISEGHSRALQRPTNEPDQLATFARARCGGHAMVEDRFRPSIA